MLSFVAHLALLLFLHKAAVQARDTTTARVEHSELFATIELFRPTPPEQSARTDPRSGHEPDREDLGSEDGDSVAIGADRPPAGPSERRLEPELPQQPEPALLADSPEAAPQPPPEPEPPAPERGTPLKAQSEEDLRLDKFVRASRRSDPADERDIETPFISGASRSELRPTSRAPTELERAQHSDGAPVSASAVVEAPDRSVRGGPAAPRVPTARAMATRTALTPDSEPPPEARFGSVDPIRPVEPDWWRPLATRIVVPDPPTRPSPTRSVGSRPSMLRARSVEPVVTAERPYADAAGVAEGAPTLLEEMPPEPRKELVDDFRAAMGWGELRTDGPTRDEGTEKRSAPSTVTLVDDDFPLGDVVFVATRETPLGRYTEQVYDAVRANWMVRDLSIVDRGIGKQGSATVVFRVQRSGRVSDVTLWQSSGNLDLDAMALDAVPKRLPPFPADLDQPSVVQRIVFSYRNPFGSSGGTQ